MPMGGPLHKAALTILDRILINGLFKGYEQGHMLGSPFYHDTHLKYTAYDCNDPTKPESEFVRNGMWIQAVANVPVPVAVLEQNRRQKDSAEGIKSDAVKPRAIHRVCHLKISLPDHKPHRDVIGNETGAIQPSIFFAILLTEFTGIAVGIIVMAIWNSWFMFLWFIPLLLKLLSALFSLARDPIVIPPCTSIIKGQKGQSSQITEKPITPVSKKFEIYGLNHGFLLVEGREDLTLQFFRHYGHPVRNRLREVAQFLTIISFVFVFPGGLLCSILWMPTTLQYVWIAYQLYATFAMHIYRYTGGSSWFSTEEKIAQKWIDAEAKGQKQCVYFGDGSQILVAELNVTYHDRFEEGKEHMERLLFGDKPSMPSLSHSESESPMSTMSPSQTPGSMMPVASPLSP